MFWIAPCLSGCCIGTDDEGAVAGPFATIAEARAELPRCEADRLRRAFGGDEATAAKALLWVLSTDP